MTPLQPIRENGSPSPASRSDFVRMADGSLVLTGAPAPAPSVWDRIKSAAASVLPDRFSPKPAPWWMSAAPVAAREPVVARGPAPTNSPAGRQLPSAQEWAEVEAETKRVEDIRKEMGTYPQRVFLNKYLMGET